MRITQIAGFQKALFACLVTGLVGLTSTASAAILFSDDAEGYTSVKDAVSKAGWAFSEGAVALSKNYAHSGSQSYQLSFTCNECNAYLGLQFPGRKRVFVRWWELRERAGDFPGAQDYDWSAEKAMRFRSATIQTTGVDYPLGWESANPTNQFGGPGTDGPGDLVIFGNSTASLDTQLIRYRPKINRGEWHMYEVEIDLGTQGSANGAVRLWIDDVLVAQRANVNLTPKSDATIGEIWVGGWYSGASPSPSPARRYIDDIVVSDQKIGFGSGSGGGNTPIAPMPPTNISVQ
jgi:hypothetical protein